MTAIKQKEINQRQQALLQMMLQKAGLTKRQIYTVAERRWVNANLDLLNAEEKREFADVLAL